MKNTFKFALLAFGIVAMAACNNGGSEEDATATDSTAVEEVMPVEETIVVDSTVVATDSVAPAN
jgi:hypothetical protein